MIATAAKMAQIHGKTDNREATIHSIVASGTDFLTANLGHRKVYFTVEFDIDFAASVVLASVIFRGCSIFDAHASQFNRNEVV